MGSFITINGRMLEGTFQARPNRFLVLAKVNGRLLPSFLPNPGRMHELFTSESTVILREVVKEGRKTKYDLIGVYYKNQTVSVDTRIPNKLVFEALKNRDIKELAEYSTIKPEKQYGHSRFDFLLTNAHEKCLLEVKSCTLVKDGVALFPDAPTERGRRHVSLLAEAKKTGYRTCVLFIIQRLDAHTFTPNDETDPAFGQALRTAFLEGIQILAYCSEFSKNTITLKGKVEVDLKGTKLR